MNKSKLIVYGGLLLAYLRTAHAMVPYSPSTVLFWSDEGLRILWAYLAALLVEGVFLDAYERLTTYGKDHNTQRVAWLIAGIALVFSGVMNIIEVKVSQGELVLASTDLLVQLLRASIVLIPLIVPALYGLMEIVDQRFPDMGRRHSHGPVISSRPAPRAEIAGIPGNSNGHSKEKDEYRLGPPGPASDPFSKRR